MNSIFGNVAISAFCLVMAGCNTSADTPASVIQSVTTTKERMTTESLTAVLSGNTGVGVNTRGNNFIQVFSTDGSLESGNAKNRGSDGKWKAGETGTWQVNDGKLCNKYTEPKVRNGGCDAFYKTSDGRYVYQIPSGKWGVFNQIRLGRSPDG